ncbi:hypothetical protein AMTR_s00044p00136160 [Amborella trichopoda]|uniref:Glucan endo-1,3-beta-D-glucosidase n=1 Tax=Amborella trichopoda TaxID=13333 RepID=U5D9V1_AMBTC|nr:hypothetical protein AMTR_s00044p00136160 [Amborella trichopoda]
MASPSLAASFFLLFLTLQRASGIGMNYGTMGTNLPSPKHAAAVLQHTLIDKVKIYDTNPTILQAFANTGISVAVTVENALIQNLSTGGPPAAADWFSSQVAPFLPATPITLISVGNEVLASDSQNYDLVPAMRNIQSAVEMSGLGRRIRVSTAHSMAVLGASFPPSASTFDEKLEGVMKPLLEFLEETGAPFLVNAYPYFAYRDNPEVELEYVLFGNATGVKDPAGYEYKNMLDAQVYLCRKRNVIVLRPL